MLGASGVGWCGLPVLKLSQVDVSLIVLPLQMLSEVISPGPVFRLFPALLQVAPVYHHIGPQDLVNTP